MADVPKQLVKQGIGSNTSRSTIFRWATSGAHGVRLDAVRIGGQWITSIEAVRRFIHASTEAARKVDGDSTPAPRTTAATTSHHAAVRKLRQRGMKQV
jgi:hypothetical protein